MNKHTAKHTFTDSVTILIIANAVLRTKLATSIPNNSPEISVCAERKRACRTPLLCVCARVLPCENIQLWMALLRSAKHVPVQHFIRLRPRRACECVPALSASQIRARVLPNGLRALIGLSELGAADVPSKRAASCTPSVDIETGRCRRDQQSPDEKRGQKKNR